MEALLAKLDVLPSSEKESLVRVFNKIIDEKLDIDEIDSLYRIIHAHFDEQEVGTLKTVAQILISAQTLWPIFRWFVWCGLILFVVIFTLFHGAKSDFVWIIKKILLPDGS